MLFDEISHWFLSMTNLYTRSTPPPLSGTSQAWKGFQVQSQCHTLLWKTTSNVTITQGNNPPHPPNNQQPNQSLINPSTGVKTQPYSVLEYRVECVVRHIVKGTKVTAQFSENLVPPNIIYVRVDWRFIYLKYSGVYFPMAISQPTTF